jgi:hypothetical protein
MRQPRANIKSSNAPRNQARRKAIFEGRLLEEGSNFFGLRCKDDAPQSDDYVRSRGFLHFSISARLAAYVVVKPANLPSSNPRKSNWSSTSKPPRRSESLTPLPLPGRANEVIE